MWRAAVVGRNGKGKTTLLRLIRGQLVPSRGTISVPLETSYFPYSPSDPELSTGAVIKSCIAPFERWERKMRELLRAADERSIAEYGEILEGYERLGGYEIDSDIEREIVEVGMRGSVLERRFGTLSGGEQTRALIIALFLRKGVFPLIDEPTNHLDMQGRQLLGGIFTPKVAPVGTV